MPGSSDNYHQEEPDRSVEGFTAEFNQWKDDNADDDDDETDTFFPKASKSGRGRKKKNPSPLKNPSSNLVEETFMAQSQNDSSDHGSSDPVEDLPTIIGSKTDCSKPSGRVKYNYLKQFIQHDNHSTIT